MWANSLLALVFSSHQFILVPSRTWRFGCLTCHSTVTETTQVLIIIWWLLYLLPIKPICCIWNSLWWVFKSIAIYNFWYLLFRDTSYKTQRKPKVGDIKSKNSKIQTSGQCLLGDYFSLQKIWCTTFCFQFRKQKPRENFFFLTYLNLLQQLCVTISMALFVWRR